MSREFEDLIRDAAPETPDPGDVRRLNRALLRQAMARDAGRRPGFLAIAAVAAVLMVFFGPITELGSDHFTPGDKQVMENMGLEYYRTGLRSQSIVIHEGMTEEQALEFSIMCFMDEGIFEGIDGMFMEDGYMWSMLFEVEIGGDRGQRGRSPEGLPWRPTREMNRFALEFQDLDVGRLEKIPAPNPRPFRAKIEGVEYSINSWRLVFPEYGPVEFYRFRLSH